MSNGLTFASERASKRTHSDPSLEGANEKPVQGIVFQGFQLSHADRQQWLPEDKGLQHDWNMWDKANGLIRFRSAHNCIYLSVNIVRNNVTYNHPQGAMIRTDDDSHGNSCRAIYCLAP